MQFGELDGPDDLEWSQNMNNGAIKARSTWPGAGRGHVRLSPDPFKSYIRSLLNKAYIQRTHCPIALTSNATNKMNATVDTMTTVATNATMAL